jgi:predicted amidophosphoribosyltransferase
MSGLALPAFDRLLGEGRRVVVTWVPCHPSSSRRRGYNQAEVLARALAAGSGDLPAVELAAKVRRTAGQRSLDRARRQGNLQGAFVALPERDGGRELGGQAPDGIVLVDDVYTTGATVQEVATVLAGSTGLPIRVFTFARALAPLSAGIA